MTVPIRKPRTDKRTLAAIDYLVSGEAKTQRQAAKLAGIHRVTLCDALRKPQYQQHLANAIRRHFKGAPAIAAAQRLVGLIDANSEDVAAKVSQRILETGGILDTRERLQAGAGVGSGPVLIVQFRHSDGAQPVQVIESTAIPAADHSLGEEVREGSPDSGRVAASDGVQKTTALADSPPSRAVVPSKPSEPGNV